MQSRSTTILRAARLMRMKEDIDYVTPEQELRLMADTTSKAHWMPKDHHPAAMNNMLKAVQHEVKNSQYEFDEIADPRGASQVGVLTSPAPSPSIISTIMVHQYHITIPHTH